MNVIARVVWVRMPIPSALPNVLCILPSVVELDVAVRVPADGQRRVVNARRIA